MTTFPEILPEPALPTNVPITAKWLSGEAAGSWFVIEKENDTQFKINRYSPEGTVECTGLFKSNIKKIDLDKDFDITYPSHCAAVSIIQGNEKIRFKREP